MSDLPNPIDLSEDALQAAVQKATDAFDTVGNLDELSAVRREHLRGEGYIPQVRRALGSIPKVERKDAGRRVSVVRGAVKKHYAERLAVLKEEENARRLVAERIDVSVDTTRGQRGGMHPITILSEQIDDIFAGMGWEVAEGPKVEVEYFNFDALNFLPDHPVRILQDTFHITPEGSKQVLRTHTSPVQVCTLQSCDLSIYVICPGRTFRTDEFDATHTPVFYQVEGLAVDKGLTMGHLRGTLDHMAKTLLGPETKTRMRTSYFPFTEPSTEADVWFPNKKGGAGWIEWGGCGMVNPNVLRTSGIDPEVYSGFALSMGLKHTLQFRNGLTDMRDMVEDDVHFTQPFGIRG